MLFNSLDFLIFFPVVTLIYWLLPQRFRWLHLLISSCVFYAAFIPIYLSILFVTIVIDYFAGIVIENAAGKRRRYYLLISIVANVGVLAVFKYYNFFTENINALLTSLNIAQNPVPYLKMILPIGLSFHTFQAMSYTIEVYRGNQNAERHFGIYALYVMFYPQLVAGPIERPQNVLFQFHTHHKFNLYDFFDGLRLMLWGFFKKLVVADRLAIYVGAVYNHPGEYHYLNLVIATLFFTVQIYCDFSGYSDIALGSAKTMGYRLMVNFDRPYFSTNISEFWSKWHISLSTWFKDYVYIPLGGSRCGKLKTYRNSAIVFLLSGFWHGANWTYVVWGGLHALFTNLYNFKKSLFGNNTSPGLGSRLAGWCCTFLVVAFTWIFFRANSLGDALLIVQNIFTAYNVPEFKLAVSESLTTEFGKTSFVIAGSAISLMFIVEYYLPPLLTSLKRNPILDVIFCVISFTFLLCFGIFYNNSFIYFQF